jgi:hypothetical protein
MNSVDPDEVLDEIETLCRTRYAVFMPPSFASAA